MKRSAAVVLLTLTTCTAACGTQATIKPGSSAAQGSGQTGPTPRPAVTAQAPEDQVLAAKQTVIDLHLTNILLVSWDADAAVLDVLYQEGTAAPVLPDLGVPVQLQASTFDNDVR